MTIEVPELEHYSGSWIVSRKSDGKAVCELFDRHNVEQFDGDKFFAETAAAYLARFNKSVSAAPIEL